MLIFAYNFQVLDQLTLDGQDVGLGGGATVGGDPAICRYTRSGRHTAVCCSGVARREATCCRPVACNMT